MDDDHAFRRVVGPASRVGFNELELAVAILLAKGRTGPEAAAELRLSEAAFRAMHRRMVDKFDSANRHRPDFAPIRLRAASKLPRQYVVISPQARVSAARESLREAWREHRRDVPRCCLDFFVTWWCSHDKPISVLPWRHRDTDGRCRFA